MDELQEILDLLQPIRMRFSTTAGKIERHIMSQDEQIQSLTELTSRTVQIHMGKSILSRDLVWCDCGRGVSTHGTWTYCPSCGAKIDQESYAAACKQARSNGGDIFRHRDMDDANIIQSLTEELRKSENLRTHHLADLDDRDAAIKALIEERNRLRDDMRAIVSGAKVIVGAGCLGCLTDDCEHFGKECSVLSMTPCLIGRTVENKHDRT